MGGTTHGSARTARGGFQFRAATRALFEPRAKWPPFNEAPAPWGGGPGAVRLRRTVCGESFA
ncbi:hypothetical protein SAMN04488036_101536 [Shimia haliotis]|uniref:Uncharacterized protein n=1 Tax=Shimia haliotis TaxID=1280847 RepID=A0A1I4AR04_9RHOB|nr:hypothetical protein SAMN04488036_101536 [Shimia haliotis]